MKKIEITISTLITVIVFTFCLIIGTNMDTRSEKPQRTSFVYDNEREKKMFSRSAIKEVGGCLYVVTEYSNAAGTSVSVVPHTSCDCHTQSK